jgi:hypothetical protein
MDWWSLAKICWAGVAMAACAGALLVLTRARGTLNWKKSLSAELKALREGAAEADPSHQQAVGVIDDHCRSILHSTSPEIAEFQALPRYLQSIAACFHPGVQRPELQVSIAAFIHGLEKSLGRFDRILRRPALARVRRARIRHINQALQWYRKITGHALYRWAVRYEGQLRRLGRLRFVFYLDPLTASAFLSNRLTLLMLVKYLLVDVYLYCGRLALEVFQGQTAGEIDEDVLKADLENALESLDAAADQASGEQMRDPDIRRIRERFVGLAAVVTATPTLADWKTAVRDAAEVIAARHFPGSAKPLEEAAIGPLLDRSRAWIATLTKAEELLIARRFYRIRLETLYRTKNFADFLLPGLLRRFIQKAYTAYGWMKWPLKVYRWARRRSPWGIAVEIGWQAAKKACLAHLYGQTFDRACRELDTVYRLSRRNEKI